MYLNIQHDLKQNNAFSDKLARNKEAYEKLCDKLGVERFVLHGSKCTRWRGDPADLVYTEFEERYISSQIGLFNSGKSLATQFESQWLHFFHGAPIFAFDNKHDSLYAHQPCPERFFSPVLKELGFVPCEIPYYRRISPSFLELKNNDGYPVGQDFNLDLQQITALGEVLGPLVFDIAFDNTPDKSPSYQDAVEELWDAHPADIETAVTINARQNDDYKHAISETLTRRLKNLRRSKVIGEKSNLNLSDLVKERNFAVALLGVSISMAGRKELNLTTFKAFFAAWITLLREKLRIPPTNIIREEYDVDGPIMQELDTTMVNKQGILANNLFYVSQEPQTFPKGLLRASDAIKVTKLRSIDDKHYLAPWKEKIESLPYDKGFPKTWELIRKDGSDEDYLAFGPFAFFRVRNAAKEKTIDWK